MAQSNYQGAFASLAAKVSVCDCDRAVQHGLLHDGFFENCCVFTDVLNQVDAKTRKQLEETEGLLHGLISEENCCFNKIFSSIFWHRNEKLLYAFDNVANVA